MISPPPEWRSHSATSRACALPDWRGHRNLREGGGGSARMEGGLTGGRYGFFPMFARVAGDGWGLAPILRYRILKQPHIIMLHWTLVFLVIALIAGVLGFSGVAGASANIAWILFVIFLILWIVSFVMRGARRP